MKGTEEVVSELLARIDVMANKFGVAAELLWESMVRQSVITGIFDLVVFIVITFMLVVYIRIVIEKQLWNHVESDPTPEGVTFIISAIIAAFVFIGALVSLSELGETMTKIFNPNYWAYKSILGGMK